MSSWKWFMNMQKRWISIGILIALGALLIAFLSSIKTNAGSQNGFSPRKEEFVDYHYLVAYLDLYQFNIDGALKNFRMILRVDKKPRFYMEYAKLLFYAMKSNEAIKVLKQAIRLYPNDPQLYIELSDMLQDLRRYKEALELLKKHLKGNLASNPEIYSRLVDLSLLERKCDAAANYLNRLEELTKTEGEQKPIEFRIKEYFYNLARCYIKNHNYTKAELYAKRFIKETPKHLVGKFLLAHIYELQGKFQKAIDIYKSIPLRTGGVFDAIGNDYYMMKQYNKALDFYKKAYISDSKPVFAEHLLAAFLETGRYKDALKFIEKYRVRATTDRLKYYYALILMSTHRYKEALKLLNSIKKPSNFSENIIYNKAICYLHTNNEQKAFELVNSIKKKNADSYLLLAKFYVKAGKYKDAIEILKKHLSAFKNPSRAYFMIADIYFEKLKNTKKAIEYLKKTLKANPRDATALNYLGYLYIDKKINVKKGIQLVKEALKLDPNNPYYLDSLGWGYYRLGDNSKALVLIQKALKSIPKPDDAVIRIHLAKIYMKLNRKHDAIETLKSIIKDYPNNRKAKELLKKLK